MTETTTNDICEELGEPRSIWKILSFNMIGLGASAAFLSITSYAFFFWETEVGLATLYVTLAFVIYGVWDAINDPLVGFIADKPYKFAKKWGRRFPWIVFGYFPAAIFALFVFFVPPGANELGLFLWLTIFLILYEVFISAGQVNHDSLYPQLFRTDKERRRSSITSAGFYYLSAVFGIVLPPLFIVEGVASSYLTGSIFILLFAIPMLILGIPGNREDERMIQQVLNCEQDREKVPFFRTIINLAKNRNFWANIIYYIAIRVIPALGFGSIPYFVVYVLGADPGTISLVMIGFLLGGVIGLGPWPYITRKLGFYKTMVITVLGLSCSMLMVMFVPDFTILMIVVLFAGFFVTGVEISDTPLAAYMIDDIVVREGRRPEGAYYGIRNVIIRVSTPITAVALGLTHILTGFEVDPFSDLAKLGIRIHFGLIPFVVGIIGIVCFVLLWNLKGEKMQEVWSKLKELDL